jgi:hypothetical protein
MNVEAPIGIEINKNLKNATWLISREARVNVEQRRHAFMRGRSCRRRSIVVVGLVVLASVFSLRKIVLKGKQRNPSLHPCQCQR